MGQYSNKGLYNSYKKNNKEREALDYYATPTAEVENILETLNFDFSNSTILEPCVGGGHMIAGIENYINDNKMEQVKLIGTDIKDRGYKNEKVNLIYSLDFLSDDYPIEQADVVIMNPPYSTLEPFLIRALEIAQDKLIVLARTQSLEGISRFKNIYMENPPTSIYQYIDRIQCWRSGVKPTGSSAQAYCWLVWDKNKTSDTTEFNWIFRKED